jgi:DNA-binding MarR family transcriptional regulator
MWACIFKKEILLSNIRRLNDILSKIFNNVIKVEEMVMKKSKAQNLSVTEIHTLEAIGRGEAKTMTHVAEALNINVSTLTAAINKLVIKGYVDRFRIPEDRRIVKVALTESGKNAVREHEAFHFVLVKEAISQLSPQETESLVESLENVHEILLIRAEKNRRAAAAKAPE